MFLRMNCRPPLPKHLHLMLLLLLLLPNLTGQAQVVDPIDRAVQNIISDMTPQQKVGQLMMVTFEGTYLGNDADIARLIRDYNIGNVILLAENDNINGRFNTPQRVYNLTTGLQMIAQEAAEEDNRPYLPLFIATTHSGNGLPMTEIATGTTPLPSYMALGATWNPEYAYQTGWIAGSELAAMGINMLLGPSLDVSAQETDLLGVETFGGEPYWVGRMGAAYIQGAHEGSGGHLAVIAQHFPGLGASDRQLSQEVPVVPRSAEELRRFDLVPFFAVTGGATNELMQVDGLQCANLRYQGENIRTETRPVCVDETAFRTVMEFGGFGDWRNRGLVVSDQLGTRAIRRWYDIEPFPHRQVARDALLAGNDLLVLADFGTNPDDNAFSNIADTVQFFAEGYLSDPVFAARVDESLRRIVRKKLEMYGNDLQGVINTEDNLSIVGRQSQQLYEIARNAVTLIAPQPEQLLPPPQVGETIVIFSDTRPQQQCSYCQTEPIIGVNALENTLRSLYGGTASGQISDSLVVSYHLQDLENYLNTFANQPVTINAPLGESLAGDLPQADWIVFALLDDNTNYPSVDVVRTFLEARPDLISSRARVVVMAFDAPYYLSTTDISKLTAYYGLYGHTPPFIDAAARALFQEVPLTGALPVTLRAVNYDLFEATSPDPAQTLRLTARNQDANDLEGVQVDDTLLLQTEPILDRNGHYVPDGTPVTFTLSFVTEGVQTQQDAATVNGVAEASFVLRRAGQVEIRVSSPPAVTSITLAITVGEGEFAAQTIEPVTETPTDMPTDTPTYTPTFTDTPTSTSTYTETPTNTPTDTPTNTPTDTPTETSTPTNTPTDTPTDTPTYTDTPTDTPTSTNTPTDTPTYTETSTETPTPTDTPTYTPSPTDALMSTPPSPFENLPNDEDLDRQLVTVSDFLLSLAGLILLIIPAFAAGWASSRSLDGSVRIVLGTLVAGLTGYVYYGAGAPGAHLLRDVLQDLAAMLITFLAGITGLIFTWWTVREIDR